MIKKGLKIRANEKFTMMKMKKPQEPQEDYNFLQRKYDRNKKIIIIISVIWICIVFLFVLPLFNIIPDQNIENYTTFILYLPFVLAITGIPFIIFSRQNGRLRKQIDSNDKIINASYYDNIRLNNPQSINVLREKYQKYKRLSLILVILFGILSIMLYIISKSVVNQNTNLGSNIMLLRIILVPVFFGPLIYTENKTQKLKRKLDKFNQNSEQNINQVKYSNASRTPKFCIKCGEKLDPNAIYCKNCWTEVPKD